jgi:hypothetical protein
MKRKGEKEGSEREKEGREKEGREREGREGEKEWRDGKEGSPPFFYQCGKDSPSAQFHHKK